jgi:hypothetical protein
LQTPKNIRRASFINQTNQEATSWVRDEWDGHMLGIMPEFHTDVKPPD